MKLVLSLIIWAAAGLLIYHYVVYYYLLKWITRKKIPNTEKYTFPDKLPTVAIVFAAHNEEKIIAQKIESTFHTTYPLEKLQVWIGSDNSTDKTHEIIQTYQQKYPNLHLKIFEQRTGKPQIINALVHNLDVDILILTDANIIFTPEHIFNLVLHFKNKNIGLVGGNVINDNVLQKGISEQETAYISIENTIKYHEGLLGCMIGAFGASYAIRRELYVPTPIGFISDDFYISMQVLLQGKKAIFEPKAIGYETFSTKITEEFRRKTRYAVGNYQNLLHFTSFWKKPFSVLFFCYFSHKVLRWLLPLFMLIALIALCILAFQSLFYLILCEFVIVGILAVLLDIFLLKNHKSIKPLRFLSHFLAMNVALLLGFVRFVFTKPTSVWKPTERVS